MSSTVTRTITSTPYGPGGQAPPPTGTITIEPTAWSWDGGSLPPESGQAGNNPTEGDCNKPANAWSIVGWVDYEFCRMFFAFTWRPGIHSATLAAWPTRYATYEPMRSLGQMDNDKRLIQTELATYNLGSGGLQSQAPDPSKDLRPAANSPWNGGQINLQSGGTTYSKYCSLQFSDTIGTGKAMEGFCFVLNLLAAKKLLWIYQAVINLASVSIASASIYNIVKIRLRYQ
jgi:hypothetical protein